MFTYTVNIHIKCSANIAFMFRKCEFETTVWQFLMFLDDVFNTVSRRMLFRKREVAQILLCCDMSLPTN